MKTLFLSIVICGLLHSSVRAQDDERAVKAVINKLFTAMKQSDSIMLQSCFTDNAILQTVVTGGDSITIVKTEPVADFIRSVVTQFKGALDERIVFDGVKIDATLASVWTPYEFFYSGKFMHCGVNSFTLVKSNREWKIQYIIDNRRKSGCKNK